MRILLLALALFFTGCAVTLPPIQLVPGANKVIVAKADPGESYELIGPVSGLDGNGCGGFGFRGTYERAFTNLLNNAHGMGGNYAQIISLTEPHSENGCYDNEYAIRAMAYKKVR